jgi:hypothetical protein
MLIDIKLIGLFYCDSFFSGEEIAFNPHQAGSKALKQPVRGAATYLKLGLCNKISEQMLEAPVELWW